MIWQDVVLGVGGVLFIAALIPSVVGGSKPAFTTSALTGTILAAYSATYATLGLGFAAGASAATAALWYCLALQKWRSEGARLERRIRKGFKDAQV